MSTLLIIRGLSLLAVACSLVPLANLQHNQVGNAKLGTISGRLSDQSGAIISTARVIITSSSTSTDNKAIEIFSNMRGEFKVDNLPPGTYDVRIEAIGFAAFSASSVIVTNNKNVELNVRLDIKKACDGEINNSEYVLTDNDKASLIRQILDHVFVIKDWVGPVDVLEKEEQLPLHIENIEPAWVRERLPKGIFLLYDLTQYKKDEFYYLKFSEFEVKGNCVSIELIYKVAGGITLGTGGYIYEFRKSSSQWVGKCIMGWVS